MFCVLLLVSLLVWFVLVFGLDGILVSWVMFGCLSFGVALVCDKFDLCGFRFDFIVRGFD